jgi:hypothetical protein
MIKKLFLFFFDLKYPKIMKYGYFKFYFRSSKLTQGMKKDLHTSLDKYELGERILIEKYVKEGDIIIEAGTSIGLITGLLSNIIGPKGYVFTIEGDNKLITIAQNINRFNNNIHFFNGILIFTQEPFYHFVTKTINCFHLAISLSANVLILDIEGEEENMLLFNIPDIITKVIIELHPEMYKIKSNDLIIRYFYEQGFVQKENFENVFSFIREK